jgi:coenzyme F420-reducing hydrogenase delta subunit
MEAENGFEPKIVAFCCHYCAYAAADLAGSLRLQYPTNIRIAKIPCSGRLDAQYVLDAFEEGADGVMVAGCLEGDCHFQAGNLHAKRRVHWLQGLLKEIGLDGERLQMYNISSAMGGEFAEAASEMTERIKELGPSPLRKEEG